MRIAVACLIIVTTTLPAFAQGKSYEIPQPKGTWQVPGEIQQPKGPWQQPAGSGKAPAADHVDDEQRRRAGGGPVGKRGGRHALMEQTRLPERKRRPAGRRS